MDLGITGRVAVVMGASAGLGRASALALAAEGVAVAAIARSADRLRDVSREAEHLPGSILAVPADVTDPGALAGALDTAERHLGVIGIAILNTPGPPPAEASSATVEGYEAAYASLVAPVIGAATRLLPSMRAHGWGRIITIASSGIVAPIPGLVYSNAMRAALVGWSKTLAREAAPDGVTMSVLAPGRIDTDRVRSLDAARATREGTDPQAVAAASALSIPAGRYGRPEECGAAVAFLASDRAGYITGSTIRVDGGLIASI